MHLNRILTLPLVVALTLCGCVSEPPAPTRPVAGTTLDGAPVTADLLGIYGVYPDIKAYKPKPPRGFRPVYISHYGRHGSRYLLVDSQLVYVSSVLAKAAEDGKLTPLGESLKSRLESVYDEMISGTQKLTPLGAEQHKGIAHRMAQVYRRHLGPRPAIVAYSSLTPRTTRSMAAFIDEFHKLIPAAQIDSATSVADMYYLNPHSPQNPRGVPSDQLNRGDKAPWRAEYREYFNGRLLTADFANRLFTDPECLQDAVRFQMELYFIAADLPNFTDIGIFDVFTLEELRRLAECDNYAMYASKGPFPGNDGRGMALSESLIYDFIEKANADLAAGTPAVRLRFGHDGCMIAAFHLMGLPGWDTVTAEPLEIWDACDISKVPMASNVQLVFYRGRGEVIFQCLFNERPYRLPIEEYASPAFYRWADFVEQYTPVVMQAREFLDETNGNH